MGFFSQQCRHSPTSVTPQSLCISLNSLVGKDTCLSFNITFQPNLQGRSGNYRCPCYHGYEVQRLQGGSSHKGEVIVDMKFTRLQGGSSHKGEVIADMKFTRLQGGSSHKGEVIADMKFTLLQGGSSHKGEEMFAFLVIF